MWTTDKQQTVRPHLIIPYEPEEIPVRAVRDRMRLVYRT